MTLRTAIVLRDGLPAGQIANVAAILMGEVVRALPNTFGASSVSDRDGLAHAAPQFSVVILRATGSGQLVNTASSIIATQPSLVVRVFSEIGQRLNNAYAQYVEQVSDAATLETNLVGIAISGPDEAVRRVTKKFSVL